MRALLRQLPLLALCARAEEVAKLPPPASIAIDFMRHVDPILRRCRGCHGAALQSSGLRLDNPADALAGGYSGAVIRPGNSADSRLIRLVAGAGGKIVMPPVGKRLTPEEVGVLRAWIDQGAKWSAIPTKETPREKAVHWASRPLSAGAPPLTRNRTWARNPIDRFILARLEDDGLDPSPEAPRTTLVRRVFLDVVGLPPSPEDVAAFLKDNRPDAWERLVDSLLELPSASGSDGAPRAARLAVNEIWKRLFGRGLAKAPEDFDEGGADPSHPELLEWLAVRFRDAGAAAVQRLIVTSAAYRQSSAVRPELSRRDPDNVLLARQACLRLPADRARDALLAVSELLDPKPPRLGANERDQYRRSLYRTGPEPPRLRDNPIWGEATRALAARLLRETPADRLAERIWRFYLICFSRPPAASEQEWLSDEYRRQTALFEKDPQAAAKVFPVDLEGHGRTETAAWTRLSGILLARDEFTTRE